ncbi:ankyrin repeat domain-containing protein [Desulfovibrio litoralis]|uniref:Ankyrin repeat n=1 Tax=Desulfovibrio litoralis DSM 11393 TaxID=1121455 RepID=A0A1M7T4M1_9BACT|nr:ankyrin repeat domain-containing protein [Desulfovibrio litoralis]SHN65624.1 Ankyrin repeat [Desulfovibrio litoralis DSM 11393]
MLKRFLIIISIFLISFLFSASAFAMNDKEFIEFCLQGWEKEVKEEIANGANINAQNEEGATPLMSALLRYESAHEIVVELIKAGADVNAKNIHGETALMWASNTSNPPLEVIKELIKAGADVNAKNNDGKTVLMGAVGIPNPIHEVIFDLIKAGADVNAKDKDGNTALDLAKRNNNTDAIEILTKAGAK